MEHYCTSSLENSYHHLDNVRPTRLPALRRSDLSSTEANAYYRSGHSATQAWNELQPSMGITAPSLATCYRWCDRFSRGEIHFNEAPRSERPLPTKTDIVLASIQNNPSQSLRGMERTTSAPRSTIHDILCRRRFRAALAAVIPPTLTKSERQVRVDVCRKLLDRKRTVAWTSFIIAQDDKLISYEKQSAKL